MKKTQLIILGGFLGAGKTTLLATLASYFMERGEQVGCITNDQAKGLVDTHILSANGLEVQEIAGSCFCCDFDGLMEAACYLSEVRKCDIIIAEPVGSCTDLSATLMQPIKQKHRAQFDLRPLSVLVDPDRLKGMLEDESQTAEGSGYIYLKQLEEADYLLLNKVDLLSPSDKEELEALVQRRFAQYPVFWISAIAGTGLERWLEALALDQLAGSRIAEVDYEIYADGEALMGWYNAAFLLRHADGLMLPWKEWNVEFLLVIQQLFKKEAIVTGHVKTLLSDRISQLHCHFTDTNRPIRASGPSFRGPSAKLVLNIRAEASPDLLNEMVEDVMAVYEDHQLTFEVIEMNKLSPGKPEPTHRFEQVIGK